MTPATFAARAHAVPYAHKGIWYGELYLFLSACLAAGVTRIIESGVKHGHSTRVLLATFDGPVVSVDRTFVIPPIGGRSVFICGDAMQEIPSLLARSDAPTGVLIDGPKGATALALKTRCFCFPSVRVVGVHDVAPLAEMAAHSHQAAFAETARGLNAPVPEPYASKYPLGGPGLGVWRAA